MVLCYTTSARAVHQIILFSRPMRKRVAILITGLFHPIFARMEFLRAVPAVALCTEMSTKGGYSTYLAEVFDTRPPIDDIKRNVEWAGALQANLCDAAGEAFDADRERVGLHR